jgi:lysozyme family protein
MADINKFIPFLFKWEGDYVNDPADAGGPTKMGVTLKTWQAYGYDKTGDGVIDEADLKRIRQEEIVEYILRPHYWNRWRADEIHSQAIANLLVDWVWCSGKYGITFPQGILGVKTDGIVGEKTLGAVNHFPDQEALFEKIKQTRRAYFNMISIDRPANKRFLKGWLNRLNDFKWIPMLFCFAFFFACKTSDKTIKTDFSMDEKMEKQVTVMNHATRETMKLDSKLWNTGEKLILEKISFYLDSAQIRQMDVTRITKEKTANGTEQTEIQTKETEDASTDESLSTVRQEKKHEVIVEKSWYRKPFVWLVGIGIIFLWVVYKVKGR